MSQIELVALDIDGCLKPAERRRTDLKNYRRVRRLIDQQVDAPVILLTGRPSQYVMAIIQDLNLWGSDQPPSLVEYGCQFISHADETTHGFHPQMDREAIEKAREAISGILEGSENAVEPGKKHMISILSNEDPEDLHEEVVQRLKRLGLEKRLEVTYSQSAVDIMPDGVNKWSSLKHVTQMYDISQDKVLGIGDSVGDLEWLKKIGRGYTPNNGSKELRNSTDITNLENEEVAAVIEMIQENFQLQ